MIDPSQIDSLVNNNWILIVAVLLINVAWIVAMRSYAGREFRRKIPRTAVGNELILYPLGVIVVGGVVRALLRQFRIMEIENKLQFLITLFSSQSHGALPES